METDLEMWVWLHKAIGFGIALFMLAVFILSGGFDKPVQNVRIPESIDTGIGLLEKDHSEELRRLRREINELKSKKTTERKEVKTKKESNKGIVDDCIFALQGLGEKRSVARATVNKYFVDNPDTKTVEEFISGVFK